MTEIAEYVGYIWGLWIAFNVALFLFSAAFFRPAMPIYNGFKVIIPPGFGAQLLTHEELMAIVEHEIGHKLMAHPWMNLLRVCALSPSSPQELMDQELAADGVVGNAAAMASALRKLSKQPRDLFRAEMLERKAKAKHGPQDAGNLTPGMGAHDRKGRQ